MSNSPIHYGKHEITEEDIASVVKVLKSDYLTQGPEVENFEKSLANFLNAKYTLLTNNATSALHLACLANNLKPKQRVIVPSLTFAATANAVRFCNGEVYFADIDPNSFTISVRHIEKILSDHPIGHFSGIISVDYAGLPAEKKQLDILSKKYQLWHISDSCHALGAEFFDTKEEKFLRVGGDSYSSCSIFSFHPVKHLAMGEGGALVTNDPEIYRKAKLLRSHGISKDSSQYLEYNEKNDGAWYYELCELGYNYRASDIHAALGTSQLKRIHHNLEKRSQIAQKYYEELKELPLSLPKITKNHKHAYHLFVIRTDYRSDLYYYLKDHQIFAQVHYIPLHRMPYYKNIKNWEGLNETEHFYNQCLSLPIYPTLTESQQDHVISTIKKFYNQIIFRSTNKLKAPSSIKLQ